MIVYAALRPCRHGENIRLIDLQQLEAARLLHVREKPSVIEPSPVSRLILQPEAVFDVVRLPGKDGFARPLLPLTVLQAGQETGSEKDFRFAALPAHQLAGGQVARRGLQFPLYAVSCKRLHKRVKRKVPNGRGDHFLPFLSDEALGTSTVESMICWLPVRLSIR